MILLIRTATPHVATCSIPAWLLQQIVQALPAALVAATIDTLNSLADPKTPALKRAVLVAAMLELIGLVPVNRALIILARFTLIHAAFVAGERQPLVASARPEPAPPAASSA